MKFNKLNSILPPGQEKFVCFEYCIDNGSDGVDALFLGTGTGHVYFYPIHKIAFARSLHPEDISQESPHGGPVTCLLFLRARSWQPCGPEPGGSLQSGDGDPPLLVSGGLDRTIKVWMPRSRNGSHYVQTLYGHDGKISCLADGYDGSFLSCASDGALKIWSPQKGRQLMRLPFFECTFSMSSTSRCWLTSMLVNHIGVWTCIVGDSSGGLEVYRKSLQGELGFEARVASYNGAILRYKRWEKVHSLGVVQVALAHDEKFVISLSSDGTAKIVDITLGAVFFSINNPRKCIYSGVLWIPSKMQFCLSDELGQVELWSLLLERKINECALVSCSDKAAVKSIISTHRDPLLGVMTGHKESKNFLALLPRTGSVVLWKMAEETSCIEYMSVASMETCMVVGFGLTPRRSPGTGLLKLSSSIDVENATSGSVSGFGPIVGSVSSILQAVQGGGVAQKDVSFSRRAGVTDKISVQHESLLEDENSFFTIDQEGMCRCWDEYDKLERYSFRVKGTQVSCVKFVWNMNCLAVGHRNGAISFWNLDSGLRFTSCKQLQAVSCMEIAKAKNCDVLIVTDFSGNIMMLNLSLFKINPLQISIDATFPGYHDAEDPAILAFAYHRPTGVVFSGGDDRSIRYWRLPKDVDFRTKEAHPGAVCCLFTTEHALISGDEEGTINVWVIRVTNDCHASGAKIDHSEAIASGADPQLLQNDMFSTRRSTLPTLQLVGSWSLGSYAAIRSVAAEEVYGGVYVSYISRLNKTCLHFLNFLERVASRTSDTPADARVSIEHAESAPPEEVAAAPAMTERSTPPAGPESSPQSPPKSGGKRLRRRSSAMADAPEKAFAIAQPQCVLSVNWDGSDGSAAFGLEHPQSIQDPMTDGDAIDVDSRRFVISPAYPYVKCFDIDEFSSSTQGKEPTTVQLKCDAIKKVCHTYVGTENGSIYKYSSLMP